MLSLFQQIDGGLFALFNQRLANPIGDFIFPLFNNAAPFIPLLILALAIAAYRHSRRVWLLVFALVLAVVIGDGLIFNPLKKLVRRSRPAVTMDSTRTLAPGAKGGFSFPSSHTANAFVIASVLTCFYPKRRTVFYTAASMVGFARIYVGVHYPSDVVGSALLGWSFGKIYVLAGRRIWHRFVPRSDPCRAAGSAAATQANMAAEPAALQVSRSRGTLFALAILACLQLLRLLWAASTNLDVPPEAAHLWCLHTFPSLPADPLSRIFSSIWFSLMGSAPLSLWMIPWIIQNIWLGLIAWFCWKRTGPRGIWAVTLLSICIPLVSQLSFLGSPSQVLAEGDWNAPLLLQSFLFYAILSLPLWIGAALTRPKVVSLIVAVVGWAVAILVPSCPWWIPAAASSGLLIGLGIWVAQTLPQLTKPELKWTRLLLVLMAGYGIVITLAVYQPRFLRKLDLSLLPRNSPQYVQTGWTEWMKRIQPTMKKGTTRQILTDSPLSRDIVQYLAGPSYRVYAPEDVDVNLQGSFWYIREVYFADINPEVIFQPRTKLFDRLQSKSTFTDLLDVFRKGDPIRQFNLLLVEPQKAPK